MIYTKDCYLSARGRWRHSLGILKAREVTKYENDSIRCPTSQLEKVWALVLKQNKTKKQIQKLRDSDSVHELHCEIPEMILGVSGSTQYCAWNIEFANISRTACESQDRCISMPRKECQSRKITLEKSWHMWDTNNFYILSNNSLEELRF